MIQRKQTIFLLLSMLVIALSFFFPILGVEGAVGQEDLLFNLSAMGGTMSGNIGLFITMLAAFLLNGAAIFAYKERRKHIQPKSPYTAMTGSSTMNRAIPTT